MGGDSCGGLTTGDTVEGERVSAGICAIFAAAILAVGTAYGEVVLVAVVVECCLSLAALLCLHETNSTG